MLLERLWHEVGCLYLSDLHLPGFNRAARQAAQALVPQEYSLREWQDAVLYLTGCACTAATPAEAQRALRPPADEKAPPR